MIKFTSNNDFDFNIESVQLITDPRSLTKRASAKSLLKYSKTKGQEDLHIIAVGAYEGTGYNRNGDRFDEKDCINNHHYFKDANRAVHRHHKNKPKDPKYGNIKAAAYNHPMKRIELVVGLDMDKCADILNEQEHTGNTNWSMASKQAHDLCSWCGHKAYTDEDRCAHIPANIGDLNKQGELCGMINPDPRWFEMSYVRRPADRIGMSLGKLASSSEVRPMLPKDFLNLYGDIYVPEYLGISKKASDKRNLLKKLAEMEKHIDAIAEGKASTSKELFIAKYAKKMTGEQLSESTLDELRKHDPSKLMKLLADKGIILGPTDFSKYLFGDRVSKKNVDGMKTHLPDIFTKLDKDNDGIVNNEKFDPSVLDGLPPQLKQLVNGLMDGHSMFGQPSVRRVMRITIIGGPAEGLKKAGPKTKTAFDQELAKQYAAYKIAALNYLHESNKLDEDILWNSLVQNRE